MKKILTFFSALMLVATLSFAQQAPAKSAKPAAKKETTKATAPTKKDGTLDMRYKVNKEKKSEVAKGPLKKDGTPDKRFKANKAKKTDKK